MIYKLVVQQRCCIQLGMSYPRLYFQRMSYPFERGRGFVLTCHGVEVACVEVIGAEFAFIMQR